MLLLSQGQLWLLLLLEPWNMGWNNTNESGLEYADFSSLPSDCILLTFLNSEHSHIEEIKVKKSEL